MFSVFADAGVTTDHRKHGPPTVFQKLGGQAAIEGVVDEFYSRVFVDDEVKGFFEGINKQKLKAHQVLCLLKSYSWRILGCWFLDCVAFECHTVQQLEHDVTGMSCLKHHHHTTIIAPMQATVLWLHTTVLYCRAANRAGLVTPLNTTCVCHNCSAW